jgi:hypothetical protein
MKESLPSNTPDERDTESGSNSALRDIHNLLSLLPDIHNEKVKREILALTHKVLQNK